MGSRSCWRTRKRAHLLSTSLITSMRPTISKRHEPSGRVWRHVAISTHCSHFGASFRAPLRAVVFARAMYPYGDPLPRGLPDAREQTATRRGIAAVLLAQRREQRTLL